MGIYFPFCMLVFGLADTSGCMYFDSQFNTCTLHIPILNASGCRFDKDSRYSSFGIVTSVLLNVMRM